MEYGAGKLIWRQGERKNSDGFISWLNEVEKAFPDSPVLVVLDNVGYHKSRKCLDWWNKYREHIRPLFLPAYAPHLNLMERVWRFMKSKLSCHRWWADLPALEVATDEILSHMQVSFGSQDKPSLTLVQNICVSA